MSPAPAPARPLRVLVVEDSPTMRAHLAAILASDPEVALIGTAADGKEAIAQCLERRPDVIAMDMMLPVMTGLAATEYIMAHCPTPILIVSASTNRGELFRTYDALAAGAVDVLEKPTGREAEGEWERRFLAALKLVARIRVIRHPRARLPQLGRSAVPPPAAPPPAAPPLAEVPAEARTVVAIGASTGGPSAVMEILRALPADFRLPILLVLHIGEPFGGALADWLDAQTGRRVAYPVEGEPVAAAAGRVVMAPPGRHLVVQDGRLHTNRDAERHSCRPSVDVLFESVARDCAAAAAACLLTGMGCDGAAGLLAIRQAGGLTIAQDEPTSVIYGMPRAAAELGAARHVLALGDIAGCLASLTRQASAGSRGKG